MKANYLKQMAAALVIVLVAVTGCKKDDQVDEIDSLNSRVASLDALIGQLKQRMDAGDMVKSITDLDSGYEIAFASGKTVEVSGITGETGTEVTQIRSIVDNEEEGTVTTTLNDKANTQYTFWKASSAFKLGTTPKVTITTSVSGEAIMQLAGSGTATINWGDGSTPENVSPTAAWLAIPHAYINSLPHKYRHL